MPPASPTSADSTTMPMRSSLARSRASPPERLEAAGHDVTTGVGATGVHGVLANGDGPTVLLRADMDARVHTRQALRRCSDIHGG
jgi:metal-dependent amidase/aminoacylase/carboxypeptidase family protein